jgi:hypothetical protein
MSVELDERSRAPVEVAERYADDTVTEEEFRIASAVLADALEEAGCSDADILGHLRGPGPHTRGCCLTDMLWYCLLLLARLAMIDVDFLLLLTLLLLAA